VVEEKRAILGRGSSYGGLLSEGKYLGWDKRRGWKPPQECYPRKRKGQTQGHDGACLSLGQTGSREWRGEADQAHCDLWCQVTLRVML
jgi:hypothetical protein